MKKYIIILSIAIVLAGLGLVSIISAGSASQAVDPISLQEAKDIAINDAGANYDSLSDMDAELDTKNDRSYYDIDFKTNGNEYSYDIDSLTGAIIYSKKPSKLDKKTVTKDPETSIEQSDSIETNTTTSTDSGLINEQDAKNAVLSRIPGASTSDIVEFRFETDDGRYEYEGKVILGEMEYEFEIDAYSGSFREWDAESLYED